MCRKDGFEEKKYYIDTGMQSYDNLMIVLG